MNSVKQLRPPTTRHAGIFCGRQNTLPVSDNNTCQSGIPVAPVFYRTVRRENTPQGIIQMRT